MLECDIPMPVAFDDEVLDGLLHVRLELGDPRMDRRGGIDRINLLLTLTIADKAFHSCGHHDSFDEELQEIEAALPDEMYLRCCHYCTCSDYGPIGNAIFGEMYCIKDEPALRSTLRSKSDLFRKTLDPHAVIVRETYLCPEFTPGKPGPIYKRDSGQR
jgi:hypothetical protein